MPPKRSLPSNTEICNVVKSHFGFEPCLFQIEDALAQLRGEDTVTIAPTGSGKTLTFWIPLLFAPGILVLITALNILGDQNIAELTRLGITAVNVTADNVSSKLFKVGIHFCGVNKRSNDENSGHCKWRLSSCHCQP